jgi:hypothetical protein
VFPSEGQVDLDQRLLLVLRNVVIREDLPGQVVLAVLSRLEDPGLDVEGLGRYLQRPGDLLEDLGGRSPQPALDLAQVGVGDAGQLREPANRQSGRASLLSDELSEVVPTPGGLCGHAVQRTAEIFGDYRLPPPRMPDQDGWW